MTTTAMNLNSLAQAMRVFQTMKPQIRASQIEMLILIAENPDISQGNLAELCMCSKSTVSKAIDNLGDEAGLLTVRNDEQDERRKLIALSKQGQRVLRYLERHI